MEQPVIVLIDPDARKIFLYGEYNREFLLDEMHIVKAFLKDKTCMFITQASEMSCDEVLDSASAILEQLPAVEPIKRFFRINAEGYTTIPELHIRFAGTKDFKPVEQFSKDVFDRSPTLCKLLKSNKLEILDEEQVAKIKKPKPHPSANSVLLEKIERDEDGNIIVPGNIFTQENEIDESTVVETDEEEAIRKGFGKTE